MRQLELKLAAQDQVIAGLQHHINGLEDIQYSNRAEYTKCFEHYEQKRKKSSRLFIEVNRSIAALQDQQARLATKEELEYVYTCFFSTNRANICQVTLARITRSQVGGHARPCVYFSITDCEKEPLSTALPLVCKPPDRN